MSYHHRKYENRVLLYGYFGKLCTTRVDERNGCTHAGGWLRVTEDLKRTNEQVVSMFWIKGYWGVAEWMIQRCKISKWMQVEGCLRVFNGRTSRQVIGREAFYYVEAKKLWIEKAEGIDESVTVSKHELDNLRARAKRNKFEIPEAKLKELEVFDWNDDPTYREDIAFPKTSKPPAEGPDPAESPEDP
jgi:hypothetical protein